MLEVSAFLERDVNKGFGVITGLSTSEARSRVHVDRRSRVCNYHTAYMHVPRVYIHRHAEGVHREPITVVAFCIRDIELINCH